VCRVVNAVCFFVVVEMFLQVACSKQVLRFVRYKPFCIFLALFIVVNIAQFFQTVKHYFYSAGKQCVAVLKS